MRYLAAYMLCQLGGKEHPTANDLKNVLESVGIESDGDRLKQLMGAMEGKEVDQLIVEGSAKLSSVPMGGGVAVASAETAAAAAAAEAPKAESKPEKEAPKEESESEEDLGFGLFD